MAAEVTVGSGEVNPGDPLAGVERPRGDAAGLAGVAGRYEAGSVSLRDAARDLAAVMGRVLGQGWSGEGAAACARSCLGSAQAVLVSSEAYEAAAGAVRQHAGRLAQAQAEYDAARRLANEAVVEERAHRAAAAASAAAVLAGGTGPGPSFADTEYQSPLRGVAQARAQQAVADATASARQTAGVLEVLNAPTRPPAPTTGNFGQELAGGLAGTVTEPVTMLAGLVGLHGDTRQNWQDLDQGIRLVRLFPPLALWGALDGQDLLQRNYGRWAGEMTGTVALGVLTEGASAGLKALDVTAAIDRGAQAASTAAKVAKGLPGALKDIRVIVIETPEGVRIPVRIDASSIGRLLSEARDTVRGAPGTPSAWLDDQTLRKVPDEWGPGRPNRKKRVVGTRWDDPNDKGNGIRIDKAVSDHEHLTQQVDHVIVRYHGKVLGRDGRPIAGAIDEDPVAAHIPLSEWLQWTEWWRP